MIGTAQLAFIHLFHMYALAAGTSGIIAVTSFTIYRASVLHCCKGAHICNPGLSRLLLMEDRAPVPG